MTNLPGFPDPMATLPILPQGGLKTPPVVREGDLSSPAAQAWILFPLAPLVSFKDPMCPMTEPMGLCGAWLGSLGAVGLPSLGCVLAAPGQTWLGSTAIPWTTHLCSGMAPTFWPSVSRWGGAGLEAFPPSLRALTPSSPTPLSPRVS